MKAIPAVLSAALALSCFPGRASACSCVWAGPFLQVSARADLIVRGKVLAYHGRRRDIRLAMDVLVLEVLQGKHTSKKIRIWGDDGALCRPYVSEFPQGTEWIFAVHRNSRESEGDYALSGCGEYWLRVEDGLVTGAISDSTTHGQADTLSLPEVRTRFKRGVDRRKTSIPTEVPDIHGVITVQSSRRGFLVEVNPDDVTGSAKARVHVPDGTPMVDREGRVYDPWRVPVGAKVSVWFMGPVAESYPVQATARFVVVEESAR